MVGIGDRVEELAHAYHEGALRQGTDPRGFAQEMERCREILRQIHREMEPLAEWTRTLVDLENQAAEEMTWISQAQRHLEAKSAELGAMEQSPAGLISFEQFIHREAGTPNRVRTR